LDAATASVAQTLIVVRHEVQFGSPKTAKGSGVISLDPATVAALREHRKRQAAERLLVGAGWRDHDLVFCRVEGTPLHPERFSARFVDKARLLGLPRIRLHALRHTWASLALATGVHPKIVQERLGHANITISLDIYSHVTMGLHSDAAEQVAGLIFGGS
jgi:integrase